MEQVIHGSFRVAPGEGDEVGGELSAQVRRQVANDAEVVIADHVAGQGEEVAGVGITMEEAIDEDLLQQRPCAVPCQFLAVDVELGHLRFIVDDRAVHEFHGEHPRRGEIPMNLGHVHHRIVAEVVAEVVGAEALHAEVELAQCPVREFLN